MASNPVEVLHDFPSFFRIYKDGTVQRLHGTDVVPPSTHFDTGVQSKDVVIVPETGISARLCAPKITDLDRKLPLLVYFHGGGFCIETAFSPSYHNYLNSLVAESNVVVVSVDYRRAPEFPLPVAYDDSWAAIQWVTSHTAGSGPEAWLKDYVDFDRVFFAGDSAGANIAHHMAIRVGSDGLDGASLVGIVLIHPFFGGIEPIGAETANLGRKAIADALWLIASPKSSGADDPLFNPIKDPKLTRLGGRKVLVCVGEKDFLRERGWYYYEELGKSEWGGDVQMMEAAGEDHVFHLLNPNCDNAVAMLERVASFLNEDRAL